VRAEAAHHPDVRLHAIPLEPAAVEDAVVGLDVQLVGGLEAFHVAVERVRVLHDELARAQQARARPRLVAFLGLEVVEQLRQVAVGAHLACDVEGEVLLVRHREDQLGPAAVLQLEDLVDVVAAGLLPELGGLEHGHQHLPRADRIHLLTHDLLRPPVSPPAGREEGPEARADLPCQPRANDQLVRDRLRVGGSLPRGWQEVAGKPGHRRASLFSCPHVPPPQSRSRAKHEVPHLWTYHLSSEQGCAPSRR
jgi:hypothetical protein